MPCYRNLLVLLHMCMSACTRPFSCGEGPGGEAIVHIAMHIMFHQQKILIYTYSILVIISAINYSAIVFLVLL